ncbi:unnamed protein product [Prorocentrum cordatum]|uniref:Uncharacterized protein n=1 Tax=Prorocentrum cordatum TaxID=2364126 RepID=A0ABN9UUS3_9DINO|nr:unnamed protein product [Polarella glacialis]
MDVHGDGEQNRRRGEPVAVREILQRAPAERPGRPADRPSDVPVPASQRLPRRRGGRGRRRPAVLREDRRGDGRVSVEPATGPGYVEVGDGGTSSIEMKSNADGSVSLTSGDDFLCSAERRVTVLTCETRKSNVESWPMQGVGATMTIHNVCFNKTWYGFKTKVDAYHERVMELTAGGQPEQLVVLVDNSDMAFGGCTYDDLLDRYDKISSLVNVPVIAGADNKLFPTTDWPYHTFEERRGRIMRAFGMTAGKFCKYTDCAGVPAEVREQRLPRGATERPAAPAEMHAEERVGGLRQDRLRRPAGPARLHVL